VEAQPRPPREELRAIRLSDPDPLGLMDVMELIAPGGRVTGWHPLPGGIGNAMHRIDVTTASGAQTAFVLRRSLPEAGWTPDLGAHAATLEGLRPTIVPAPELLWLDMDGAVFGRPAMAVTLLPGGPRSTEVTSDPVIVRGLAEALVMLHWVTDLVPFEHLERDDTAEALLGSYGKGALPAVPFADTAAVRRVLLDAMPDLGPLDIGLTHGDFHIGNVLFDGNRVAGIVDWDGAALSDPRADVAYAAMDLAIIGGLDVADTFLAEYEALRGPVSELDWWCLRATLTTWRDVASWLPGWHELGIAIDIRTVHARLRAWTDRHLAALAA
jgi:aminoglycoside phosphotransferase (APT) family kinase protein